MNEALIARGGVPVELDRTRVLFFDKIATFHLVQKYPDGYLPALYKAGKDAAGRAIPLLKDIDALEFFLWAGLQYEAREHGEAVTLEQAGDWIMPSTESRIFDAVIVAITRGIHTPPLPGKASAATASPAATAKTRASTSPKRSGSRLPSSVKARKPSGPRR